MLSPLDLYQNLCVAIYHTSIALYITMLHEHRMHCKIVFNFALRHDLALLQDNPLLAKAS